MIANRDHSRCSRIATNAVQPGGTKRQSACASTPENPCKWCTTANRTLRAVRAVTYLRQMIGGRAVGRRPRGTGDPPASPWMELQMLATPQLTETPLHQAAVGPIRACCRPVTIAASPRKPGVIDAAGVGTRHGGCTPVRAARCGSVRGRSSERPELSVRWAACTGLLGGPLWRASHIRAPWRTSLEDGRAARTFTPCAGRNFSLAPPTSYPGRGRRCQLGHRIQHTERLVDGRHLANLGGDAAVRPRKGLVGEDGGDRIVQCGRVDRAADGRPRRAARRRGRRRARRHGGPSVADRRTAASRRAGRRRLARPASCPTRRGRPRRGHAEARRPAEPSGRCARAGRTLRGPGRRLRWSGALGRGGRRRPPGQRRRLARPSAGSRSRFRR